MVKFIIYEKKSILQYLDIKQYEKKIQIYKEKCKYCGKEHPYCVNSIETSIL